MNLAERIEKLIFSSPKGLTLQDIRNLIFQATNRAFTDHALLNVLNRLVRAEKITQQGKKFKPCYSRQLTLFIR